MNKTKIFSVLEYVIIVSLMIYSIVRGILSVVGYVNYDQSESSMTQNGYLFTGIVFLLLFVSSLIVLVLKINRDMYRKNFTHIKK